MSGRWPLGSAKNIALGFALLFFQPLVPIVPFVLLRPLLYDGDVLRDPTLLSFAAALASFLPVALLVGGGLRSAAGLHLRALGWRADHLPREILLGIAGLALYLIAIFGWVRLLTPEAFAGFVHGVAAITVRQRVLFAVIGAAIAIFEESIARGFLQPNLMHRLGPWPGFAATALVFAAWHPPTFFLLGFLVRLSLGVIVGALRWRDRPLVAPAIAHALLWVVVGNS